ncbi:MAG: hypothetical protein C4335_05570 [Armatimonadota bacterium]
MTFREMNLRIFRGEPVPHVFFQPLDGLEALTPLPQGDVSPEEIKEHIGDKVLLDGIPAILFLPPFTREQVMEMVEKLVKLFHPRLVLGISDELPESGGAEPIERVRLIADWCRRRSMRAERQAVSRSAPEAD